MVSLVFLGTAINYLDRQTLSAVPPVSIDHFHMSNEVCIFPFMLAYTIL
jgi:hypothetical protein